MAHNSNSHDAPWLPNSQTEIFSVYADMSTFNSLFLRYHEHNVLYSLRQHKMFTATASIYEKCQWWSRLL